MSDECKRGTITQHHALGRHGQRASVFDGAYRYTVKAKTYGTLPPLGAVVWFRLDDGLAEIIEVEESRSETLEHPRERLDPAARAQSDFLDAVGRRLSQAEASDADLRADQGDFVNQEDVETEQVTTPPMRVQEVIQDAQPLPWEMKAGHLWTTQPEPTVEIHVEKQGYRDWCWRVRGDCRQATGNADSAAAAILAAEAVYWLSVRSVGV